MAGSRSAWLKRLGFVLATLVVAGWMSTPAVANGERGAAVAAQAGGRGPMKETVHAILAEAGLSPGRIDRERQERIMAGIDRLVEVGVIDESDIEALTDLAMSGQLGPVMSERARGIGEQRRNEKRASD